ncbi:inositol 2-dehydrogenase [Thermosediminibacter litoriperuensis]|uniref:Myo-inositol 2-dehydrogenase n=1 Tax=Thermosediminibacter litoriperuensis TaxID=291989 RepID=A0A5S5ADJ6_9FIRM|nr:inositol 2-dehydrogenase [Thermosediminibacter litoriperuensis]TYP47891.1 myo-inositol 2-dehydrogenase [Thermosediminibacter litoriperuensis]
MGKKIKVGLIGAGRIGRMHAENINAHFGDVELKAIADIYAEKIKDWAYGICVNHVYEDYKKIIEDPEIDAVLICSSTDTHCQLIIESAKAGKQIFCEKPIDFDLDRIKKALEEVRRAGVKLQIGFQRRFDPHFRKAKKLIDEGRIGDIHIIRITSRDPEPPPIEYVKVSGGIFLDMTIHDFDMARFLSGSEVEEVFAYGAVMIDQAIGEVGDIDTAVVNLKFKNGAIAVIDNSRKAVYGYDQRVEVFGSQGCLRVENVSSSNVVMSTSEGIISDKPKHFFIERYHDAYIKELREFFDSIINDEEPSVTGRDGLEPVIIGLAAQKSLEEGRPVRIER